MPNQLSLLDSDNNLENISLAHADIRYYADFITDQQCWYEQLVKQLLWQQSHIQLYGKTVAIPRLNAWYGDCGANYGYSGQQLHRQPWLALLQQLKHQLEQLLGCTFNSVLANYYRDGNDGVAWHADDEPELGEQPVIASLSFGATRRFSLKAKPTAWGKAKKPNRALHLDLAGGSLLVMAGRTQQFYYHQIAKTQRPVAGRVNLTFRSIV